MTMRWRRLGATAVAGLALAGGAAFATTSAGDDPEQVASVPTGALLPGEEPVGAATPTTPTTPTTLAVPSTTTTTVPTTTIVLPRPAPVPLDPRAVEPAVVVGTIEIPRLGLAVDLHEGISLNTIDRGPSHWPGTALPGKIGNVVVAGHRVTKSRPFRHIDQLQAGDEIVFTVEGRRSVYRVTGSEVVPPDALHIATQTAEPVVTLFACHPPGSAKQRYVIRGAFFSSAPA